MSEIEERAWAVARESFTGSSIQAAIIERALRAERRLAFERAAEIARVEVEGVAIAICKSMDGEDCSCVGDRICPSSREYAEAAIAHITRALLAEIDQPPTPPGETPA